MTVFSKLLDDEPEKVCKRLKEKEAHWPPPISFSQLNQYPKKGKTSKDDSEDEEKSPKYREFEIRLDLNDEESDTYKKKVSVFEDGTPLEWCEWREKTNSLLFEMGINDASGKNST